MSRSGIGNHLDSDGSRREARDIRLFMQGARAERPVGYRFVASLTPLNNFSV